MTALIEAGYRAWTPRETRVIRLPRSKLKREIIASLTPTIAFSDYDRLPELVAMSRSPLSRVPDFHVFRHLDVYARIPDRALDALRLAEQRGRPRSLAHVYQRDDRVKYPGAGFEGLIGRVEGVKGRYTLVAFPGFAEQIRVPAHSLLPVAEAA
ncbi:hypothetical protein [uncultured Novosphingobium sp.]|uniref:hypothetical protein n=1 Tax=uncultured Novosphingobium sp. TaxID=292277 RepID=UPI0037479196